MKFTSLFSVILLAIPALLPAADPPMTSVDKKAMNMSVDPCVDFYQYACGNWIQANPLPADRSRWGRFAELSDHNEHVLLDMLQGAAVVKANRSRIEQQIGDAYASCMDTATINARGIAPLQPELAQIAAIANAADVTLVTARLHRQAVGVIFTFGSRPDAKDSTKTIAFLAQGGLALPDRDYYLKTDPKSVEIRQKYVEHMTKMFQLAGDSAESAAAKAKMVLDLETAIANASADRVTLRDPNKTYHIVTRQELAAMAPAFDWNLYFKEIGAPAFDTLNVSWPDYVKKVSASLSATPIGAFKAYFEFHLLHARAARLPEAFENEDFDFWQRTLSGTPQPRPRQFRCVQFVDRSLGDLLGQKYIELAFGADAKAQITQLVANLEKAMGEDIRNLPWMTEETKKAAIAKLNAITNNVGYPKKWRDYGNVKITRDDFYGNAQRVTDVLYLRQIEKIGKATDKTEWGMTTPTVNAFYSPQNNSINFPAGILQTPFFDPHRDPAVNYGGVGAVIGHEMTHGFDDQGRKYDGDGNLRDWWTQKDGAEFEKRASCIADEYSGFSPMEGVNLNGRLTLGENSADNGGLRIAYMAMENATKDKHEKVDGLTPEQRFFLGFAQLWCENMRPDEARQRAMTDPHSPGKFRVNGTVVNMPEFQKAYSCKAGQPMVHENSCRVW
ncbi:MAG TPA: M13 family metallopeptidase [Verrucomicrobiae bacterium]|nr:M13 family metallopeptidase [Verrucomicrobiae bacterium]